MRSSSIGSAKALLISLKRVICALVSANASSTFSPTVLLGSSCGSCWR